MEKLIQIAPVYYVTGNHEWWSGKFDVLEQELLDSGVNVMRNTAVEIVSEDSKIQIIGFDDPANSKNAFSDKHITEENIRNSMRNIEDGKYFKILLAHRPEMLSLYQDYDFDLVFSGHAHGGQFRIPFIGGLIAPDQGLFPDYTSGIYKIDNTTMIVNRGLGNSVIPQRLFNRPEIVVVTLNP